MWAARRDRSPTSTSAGGAATLFTARLFGRLADHHGKVRTFTWLALAVTVPIMATPLLPRAGAAVGGAGGLVQPVRVLSGRMIPGMAWSPAPPTPALRGTFMALNAAVQSAAMGWPR
jgi:predicted MFS family arabinose efflux permease